MADKTLPPTAKRRLRARNEGTVSKSAILTTAVCLSIGIYALFLSCLFIGSQFKCLVALTLLDQCGPETIFEKCVLLALLSASSVITPITIAACAVELLQLGGKVYLGATWNRPFNQIWSGGVVRIPKGLIASWQPLLILLMSLVMFAFIGTRQHPLKHLGGFVGFLIGVGVFDWWMKCRSTEATLRMDQRELIDEHKDSEGDPHLKAHRKMMQRALAYESLETRVKRAKVIFVEKKYAGRRSRKNHY